MCVCVGGGGGGEGRGGGGGVQANPLWIHHCICTHQVWNNKKIDIFQDIFY